MIFPFLDGFLSFTKAPITWTLILFNIFLYTQHRNLSEQVQAQFNEWYEDEEFLSTQGQLYRQYASGRDVAQVANLKLLGRLAFRDDGFLQLAPSQHWQGDQVAIDQWRESLSEFLVLRSYYPALIFGLSENQSDWVAHLTYQFYHEGLTHLLGNILLILLVGGYLERRYSGLGVFFIYLTGGFVAAASFVSLQGLTGAPLVGASGSLCALLGFITVTEFLHKTRLFYFVLPSRAYMGFVLVPTVYWVIWLLMLEDLAGLWGQSTLYSAGVAYWVHIYGYLAGLTMGWIYLMFRGRPEHTQVANANHLVEPRGGLPF